MPLDELQRIAESVEERRGWNFSRVLDDIDPVPWVYEDVVRPYLSHLQRVLDIGTGGGERFLSLADYFGSGIGIDADPEHLAVAEENLQKRVACRVKFLAMDAAALEFPTESFDVVLNRHAPAHPAEVARVLKPGGTFITQQVGARNTANICTLFGCGPGGLYADDTGQEIAEWANEFRSMGLVVRVRAEYDVPYFFCDVESLVFWLKAIPMPEDFDITRHWSQVDEIIATTQTLRGFATNEHRELLVVQKT